MTLKIAQFLSTMLFALVMGVFWGTWFTLSRSITQFQPQTFLDIGQTAIRNRDGTWTWQGEHAAAREFQEDSKTLTARHERSDDGKHWEPSMTVKLRKIE